MKHKIVQMLNMTQTDEAQWNFSLQNQVSSTLLKAISFGSQRYSQLGNIFF